ncbi:MAG: NfeD family protein [Actinomycetota bacterium]
MRNTVAARLLLGLTAVTLLAVGAFGMQGAAAADAPTSNTILSLHLTGVVDPFVADAIRGGIQQADTDGDAAVLLTIDTPGGLSSSMREITEAILGSNVPVICYVGPPGARAASAGAYILLSCPVAAMAPGTNVGASTPVGLTGGTEGSKVVEDATATIQSLAETYGRNAKIAATFVTDSLSISAKTAVAEHIADMEQPTQAALLGAVSGTTVTLANGDTVTFGDLTSASISERHLAPLVGVLHDLFDPNLAFIFFWLGLILIVIEIIVPGHIFSGTVGTVLFLIAIASFGFLPIRSIGVALLVASAVLLIVEVKTPTHGALTGVGLACLVAGGLLLYNGSGGVTVSPLVLIAVTAMVAAFFGLLLTKLIGLRHMTPALSPGQEMVGREGVALAGGLGPTGVVRVASEEWRARAGAPLAPGSKIKVTALDGLVLTVEPVRDEHGLAGGSPQALEGRNA